MPSSFREYISVFRGLDRPAKLLILVGGVNSIPFGVFSVALPIYLHLLGYETVVIGTVFSIQGAVAVVLIIPFGILGDRYGRKRIVVLGGLLSAGSFLLFPFADVVAVLYLAAVLAGLAGALAFAPYQAMLADVSREEERTAVFGMSSFVGAASGGLGALAASTPDLLRSAGWGLLPRYAPLFVGCGIVILLGAVLVARLPLREERHVSRRGLLPRRSARLISKFFVSNMIIGLGAGLIIPIFSLWFLFKYGQTEAFTGPLFAVGSVTNAIAFLVAPLLAREHGLVRTVVTLQAAATFLLLGLALLPEAPVLPWLLLASALFLARNATMNMSSPVSTSFLMGAVPPEERSSASAVVGVSFRLPFAVSTTFGAAMMAQDADFPLFVTASLYAVGVTVFYVFFRNVPEMRGAPAPPETQAE